jgi:hypothetical protein
MWAVGNTLSCGILSEGIVGTSENTGSGIVSGICPWRRRTLVNTRFSWVIGKGSRSIEANIQIRALDNTSPCYIICISIETDWADSHTSSCMVISIVWWILTAICDTLSGHITSPVIGWTRFHTGKRQAFSKQIRQFRTCIHTFVCAVIGVFWDGSITVGHTSSFSHIGKLVFGTVFDAFSAWILGEISLWAEAFACFIALIAEIVNRSRTCTYSVAWLSMVISKISTWAYTEALP